MPQTPTEIARVSAHRAVFAGAMLFIPALIATTQPATAAPDNLRPTTASTSSACAVEKHIGVWGWTSGSQTYLRARPGAQTPPVAKVSRHTKLFVWGTYNGWYRVETPDHVFGWVFNSYISAPDAEKLPKLSHQKARQASDRTARQTMYGSPAMLRQFYVRYGAPGAVKGLRKQGMRLASASAIRAAGNRKKTTRIAKTESFDAASRTRSPRLSDSDRLSFDDPTLPSSHNRALAPRLPATSWASRERAVRNADAAPERFAIVPPSAPEAPLAPRAPLAPESSTPRSVVAPSAAARAVNAPRRVVRTAAPIVKVPAKAIISKATPVKTLPKAITRRAPAPRLAVAPRAMAATTTHPHQAGAPVAPTRVVVRSGAPRIAAPSHEVAPAPRAGFHSAPRIAAKPRATFKPRALVARRPAPAPRVVPAPRLALNPPVAATQQAPIQSMRETSPSASISPAPMTRDALTPSVTTQPVPQMGLQPGTSSAPATRIDGAATVAPRQVKPMTVTPIIKPAKAAAPGKKRLNWRVVRREQRRQAHLAAVAQRRARLRLRMGAPAKMIPPLSSPALAPISPQELMRARDSYLSARKPTAPPAPGFADAKPPVTLSPSSWRGSTPGGTRMPVFPIAPSAPFYVISARQAPIAKARAAATPAKAISRGGSPRDYALYYQQRQAKPQTETSPFGQGLASQALTYRGMPYIYGSASPRRGFDCSGLLFYMLRQRGYNPPRTAAGYRNYGQPVAKNQLQPGDILLFANTYKRGISHVGVYAGNGKFVHAATSGQGVRVDALNSDYYAHKYYGARRIK